MVKEIDNRAVLLYAGTQENGLQKKEKEE